jgi:LysM repeat protein
VLVVGALGYKYLWPGEADAPAASAPSEASGGVALQAKLPAAGVRTKETAGGGVQTAKATPEESGLANRPAGGTGAGAAANAPGKAPSADRIKAGRQALAAGKLVEARTQLNAALIGTEDASTRDSLIDDLEMIAEETLFSPVRAPDDPLVSSHVVASGDSLQNIAKRHKVTVGLLARINHIADVNLIRAGQTLKVLEGPFHASVDKTGFELHVYLSEVLVKRYRVGLGEFGSTPTGEWRVKNKLTNPTYYPPRGGPVVTADDPENPLGERWIGLEGVSGEAVGQQKYGIHGTVQPESIGKNLSLGCVRLLNPDVEFLYDLLVVNGSRITIHK